MRMILVLLCASLWVRGAEEALSWDFTMEPGAKVEIETFKGLIDIQTHASQDITVRALIRPDGDDCDPTTVEVFARERGGGVHIWIEHHPNGNDGFMGVFKNKSYTAPFVDFTILMPDNARLEIDDHKSQYDIQAPLGSVQISTHKGEGTISNVRSDFELDTHKGVFDIHVTKLDDIDVDTYKGHITVNVAQAQDFDLRAETYKGELEFKGRPVTVVNEEDREKTADYREGSGSNSIRLETYKGTIELIFED